MCIFLLFKLYLVLEREIATWVPALAALTEDPSLAPAPCQRAHNCLLTPALEELILSSDLYENQHTCSIHSHRNTYIHTNKTKNKLCPHLKTPKDRVGGHGGLRNVAHRLMDLNTWFFIGGAAWGGHSLHGGSTSLRQIWGVYNLSPTSCPPSLFVDEVAYIIS